MIAVPLLWVFSESSDDPEVMILLSFHSVFVFSACLSINIYKKITIHIIILHFYVSILLLVYYFFFSCSHFLEMSNEMSFTRWSQKEF